MCRNQAKLGSVITSRHGCWQRYKPFVELSFADGTCKIKIPSKSQLYDLSLVSILPELRVNSILDRKRATRRPVWQNMRRNLSAIQYAHRWHATIRSEFELTAICVNKLDVLRVIPLVRLSSEGLHGIYRVEKGRQAEGIRVIDGQFADIGIFVDVAPQTLPFCHSAQTDVSSW